MIFRNWVLENFPFLENDFDALTDYELFCKMMEYVKEVAKDNEEIIKLLENLQPYIDEKLDEMAEDGTLADIINQEVFQEINAKIGELTNLTTSNKTSLVGAINEVNAKSSDNQHVYGIIRPTSEGWSILNDSQHEPVNLDSVYINNEALIISHNHGFTKVNSFQITSDETFTKYGITAGASVGLNTSRIEIYQNLRAGGYIRLVSNVPTIQTNYSNLITNVAWSTDHLIVNFDSELIGCYPNEWIASYAGTNQSTISADNKDKRLEASLVNNTTLYIYCLLSDDSFSTDITDFDRILVYMNYCKEIKPADLVTHPITGANFWIEGTFE